MEVIQGKNELRDLLAEWGRNGEHIAVVPTMGNLHGGHLSLVNVAREHAERVVVTVFVNPVQFGADEDFEDYPRTFDRDTRKLRTVNADVLFAPDVETVYPFGLENATRITVPGLSEHLCGSHRPGHFDGVTTVVARLFALVRPDVAVFGKKDFQQLLVIRRMIEDLSLPLRVVAAETIREQDGLAMSSRNTYLSDDERQLAPALYQVLVATADEIRKGQRDFEELEARAVHDLGNVGFAPEYIAIRQSADLGMPGPSCAEFVVLAAAQLGAARLIDNVLVSA